MGGSEDLGELLARWREQRDPALADAIDLIGASARGRAQSEARSALASGSVAQRVAAWTELAQAPAPELVGELLRAFPIGTIEQGMTQLERLAELDDPRVATRLVTSLEDPPYRSPAALEFWQRSVAVVEALRDPRAIGWFPHYAKLVQTEFAPPMGRLVERELKAATKRVKKRLAKVAEASPANLELLAKTRAAHRADANEQELLAGVHAAPEDDAPRLVYADYASAIGDPRGEFIALQFAHAQGRGSRASKKREKELLSAHALEWLGPLAPVVNKTGLEYRRGFPDTVVFRPNNRGQVEKLVGHPAWSTVRVIHMESCWPYQEVADAMVLSPAFRSLRELRGFSSPELLVAVTQSETPRPWTRLEFDQLNMQPSVGWSINSGYTRMPPEGPKFPPRLQAALSTNRGLPQLRELELRWLLRVDAKFMRWLFFGPLGMQLERFDTQVGTVFLPTYMRELAEHPLAVFSTLDEERNATYTLTRGDSGAFDQLHVAFRRTNRSPYDATPLPSSWELLMTMLGSLGRGELARLELRWSKKYAPTAEQLEALATWAGAHPEVELTHPAS